MGVVSIKKMLKEFNLLDRSDDIDFDEDQNNDVCAYWSDKKTSAKLIKALDGKYAEEVFFLFEVFAGEDFEKARRLAEDVAKDRKKPSLLIEHILKSDDEDIQKLQENEWVLHHAVYFAKHFNLSDEKVAKIFQAHDTYFVELKEAAKKPGNKIKQSLLRSKFFQWFFKVFKIEHPPEYSEKDLEDFKISLASSSDSFDSNASKKSKKSKPKSDKKSSFNSNNNDKSKGSWSTATDENDDEESSEKSSQKEESSFLWEKFGRDNLSTYSKALVSFLDASFSKAGQSFFDPSSEEESVDLNHYVDILELKPIGDDDNSVSSEDLKSSIKSTSSSSIVSNVEKNQENLDDPNSEDDEISKLTATYIDILPLKVSDQHLSSEKQSIKSSGEISGPNLSVVDAFGSSGMPSSIEARESGNEFFDTPGTGTKSKSFIKESGVDLNDVSLRLDEMLGGSDDELEIKTPPKKMGGFLNLVDHGDQTPPLRESESGFLNLDLHGDETPRQQNSEYGL